MNNTLLGITAISLYVAATLFLAGRFRKKTGSFPLFPQLLLTGLALLFHVFLLSQLLFQPDGINLGFFNSLTLLAWLSLLIGLTISLRESIQHIALVLMPINIITIALALVSPPVGH
ncbi:MAG TPA: hypothetical protein VFX02_02655, partial [Gammaproteobacteria bacterium]|nr:hypothetical protein [Gammaproteobacteria bacterium]